MTTVIPANIAGSQEESNHPRIPLIFGECVIYRVSPPIPTRTNHTAPAAVATYDPFNPQLVHVKVDSTLDDAAALAAVAEVVADLCRAQLAKLTERTPTEDEPQARTYNRCPMTDGTGLCPCCGKGFTDVVAFRAHLFREHRIADAAADTILYPLATFKERQRIITEILPIPIKDGLGECPYCLKTFESACRLHNHLRKFHEVSWDDAATIAEPLLVNKKNGEWA